MMLEMELWYLRSFWTWSPSSLAWSTCSSTTSLIGEVGVVGGFRVEDSVAGFLGVWDEVVVVEVADEIAEF